MTTSCHNSDKALIGTAIAAFRCRLALRKTFGHFALQSKICSCALVMEGQMNEDSVLTTIQNTTRFHWKRHDRNVWGQWITMIVIAVAGAVTTFSGTPASEGTFVKLPGVIFFVGIVAAVGAAINQFWNFSRQISRHRAAALGHQAVALQLQAGSISEQQASKAETLVFKDPEAALALLAGLEKAEDEDSG